MKAVRDALLGELSKMRPGRRRAVAIGTGVVAAVFALFAAVALVAPTWQGQALTSGLLGFIVLAIGAAWFAWVAVLAARPSGRN